MEAQKYSITVVKGSTFRLNLALTTGAPAVPIDLTGYKARSQMRYEYESTDAFLTFTSDDTTLVLGGALGTISMMATATDTAAIDVYSGVWDLELVDPTGDVQQLLYGSVSIRQEATRNENL
jgi:hypothetical protein